MIVTKKHVYGGPGGPFEGTISWDDTIEGPRPGILVSHAFGGQGAFDTEKAEALAAMGYVGFALDVYGQGRRASTSQEAVALMHELTDNRPLLLARMQAALAEMASFGQVDENRLAGIGFCFGGKCLLDLARAGVDMRGIVSFHGVFDAPPDPGSGPIPASILLLHGWEDPIAKPHQFVEIAAELTARGADWQAVAYGSTGHAFTNPAATDHAGGMAYVQRSSDRAWLAMRNFLEEVLA